MKEARLVSLAALVAIPLAWSATMAADTRAETVNQALSALMLGAHPLLGFMLLCDEDLRGADMDVRYGMNRRVVAGRQLVRIAATLVAAGLIATTAALVILRGARDPLFLRDLLATTPIAIAAGLSLTGFFALARVWFGKVGLSIFLLLSWILGSLNTPAAVSVPSGHVRHLLGLGAELPLPAWGSYVVLYGATAILSALILAKIPR